MRVSVVIPTYNRARFLLRAIDSVVGQTFDDWDLLVVDDGSIDETAAVVASFTDPRIRYLSQVENRGQCIARNVGIDAARGDYVAFLDSDDAWDSNKLERQLEAIDIVGADACLCGRRTVDLSTGDLVKETRQEFEGKDLLGALLTLKTVPSNGCLLVDRVMMSEVGFDDTMKGMEDRDTMIRLAQRVEIVAIPEPLTTVYEHDGPRVRGPDDMPELWLRMLDRHGHLIDRRTASQYHYQAYVAAYQRGRFEFARRELWNAVVRDPRSFIKWLRLAAMASGPQVYTWLARLGRSYREMGTRS